VLLLFELSAGGEPFGFSATKSYVVFSVVHFTIRNDINSACLISALSFLAACFFAFSTFTKTVNQLKVRILKLNFHL